MRIIIADSGQEVELSNSFLKTLNIDDLNDLKQAISNKVQIKPSNQILLTPSGTQIKDNSTNINIVLILFNRRLLQDPSSLISTYHHQQQSSSISTKEAILQLKELEAALISIQNNEDEENRSKLIKKIKENTQIVLEACIHRKRCIDKLKKEIGSQSIALNSALNNLESHVKAALQNVSKFDRIAQREFAKDAIAIASIDLEIELLKQINLHSSIPIQSSSLSSNTLLAEFVPVEKLKEIKRRFLLKEYDELVNATREQSNKMVYLNQQTANTMSLHRMTSDVIKKRVTKMKQRVDRFVYTLIDVEQRGWSSSITTTIKGDHSISSFPLDITQTQSSPLNLHDSPSYFNHLQQKRKTADDTILNTIHLLYLYDQLIYESECSILEEKKTTFDNFIQCMQSVSKIEQSVMQIYPRLAELEKRMKQLRFEIEYGQGAIARKVITGYGILLCEVWRRSTYSELIMKNTNLLGDLFEHFKKREDDYRKNFIENEVICLEQKEDKLFVSLHHVDDNKKRRAILPFIIQEDLNSLPVSNEESNRISIKDIEAYIQIVHGFYKENSIVDVLSFDVASILKRKLEIEAKRLNKERMQLELSMKGDKEKIVLTAYVPIKTYNNKKMYADQDSSIESNKDKTLILQQFQEYKSRIKEIQLKHEQYKKDKQNLLEELNCKERYIEEMKTKHQQEIQNLSLQIKEINQKDDKQRDMMQCPLLSPPHENIKTIKSEPTTPYYEQDPVLSINEHERRIIQQLRYDHAQEIQQLQQRWEAERAAQLQKFRDIQERDHADVIALVNALAAEKTQLLDQLTQVKNDLSNNSLFSYHHDDKETRLLNKEINILQIHTVQMEEEKDDLQNEIGQLKADRDKIYKDFINFKRETNEANLELLHLRKEQLVAKRLAKDLLSISQPNYTTFVDNDDTISLVDLLKRTLGNITNLQAHNNNLEESMESAYMTGMYPY